jgi:hypothetical protein
MTIVATPVIDKQYWILKRDDQKIGALEAEADGYTMRIDNSVKKFKTIPMVRKNTNIVFEPAIKTTPPKANHVYGIDTGCKTFNPIWDVKHKLPLFTKERKSKSWYAAGWYRVKQHRHWRIFQNPKLIVLERYQYQGPFHTKEQASDQSI